MFYNLNIPTTTPTDIDQTLAFDRVVAGKGFNAVPVKHGAFNPKLMDPFLDTHKVVPKLVDAPTMKAHDRVVRPTRNSIYYPSEGLRSFYAHKHQETQDQPQQLVFSRKYKPQLDWQMNPKTARITAPEPDAPLHDDRIAIYAGKERERYSDEEKILFARQIGDERQMMELLKRQRESDRAFLGKGHPHSRWNAHLQTQSYSSNPFTTSFNIDEFLKKSDTMRIDEDRRTPMNPDEDNGVLLSFYAGRGDGLSNIRQQVFVKNKSLYVVKKNIGDTSDDALVYEIPLDSLEPSIRSKYKLKRMNAERPLELDYEDNSDLFAYTEDRPDMSARVKLTKMKNLLRTFDLDEFNNPTAIFDDSGAGASIIDHDYIAKKEIKAPERRVRRDELDTLDYDAYAGKYFDSLYDTGDRTWTKHRKMPRQSGYDKRHFDDIYNGRTHE